MKLLQNLFTIILLTFALGANAAPPAKLQSTAEAAVNANKSVQRALRDLKRAGFEVLSEEMNSIMYLVQPTEQTYYSNLSTIRLVKPCIPNTQCLRTESTFVYVEVFFDQVNDGYFVNKTTTTTTMGY